ncbi:hypothetical protein Tco_0390357 [Tanacetum coccineum]
MNLKLCYNTFNFKEGETLTQTFIRYKALMNELVNDGIKLSNLKINNGFINGLLKKWLSFCQSLRNTNHVKDSELASLFGRLKYEENLIDSIFETKKKRSLVSATPLSTAFFSTSIVQDFQDSPDNEEDTRSLAVQRQLTKLNATNVAGRDEEEVSSDDNEMVEVKVLLVLAEENDVVNKEGARNGEWVKIFMRKVYTLLEMEDNDDRKNYLDYLCIDLNYVEEQKNNLMSKHRDLVQELNTSKEQLLVLKQAKLDFLTMFYLPNHDTGRILPAESQRNTTEPLVAVIDSSKTDYDLADESSVCKTSLPPLEKLDGTEPVFGPKTIKSILKSKSIFKAEALKGVIIKEPSSAPAKGNKSASASKVNSAPIARISYLTLEITNLNRTYDHAEYMSTMNMSQHLKRQGGSSLRSRTPSPFKHFFPPCIHYGFSDHLSDDYVKYPICDICKSYDHDTHGYNMIISLRRGIKPRNPQHVMKSCETSGSTIHTITITKTLSGSEKCDIRKPIWYLDNGCSRHMTGVKRYLHKYVKQPGPKLASVNSVMLNILFSLMRKEEQSLTPNKEVVMIAPRVRDVYVLNMTSSAQESCFFAKASENINWLWHKRLAHCREIYFELIRQNNE